MVLSIIYRLSANDWHLSVHPYNQKNIISICCNFIFGMAPCLSMCRWGGEEQQHNSTISNETNGNDLVRYSAKEGAGVEVGGEVACSYAEAVSRLKQLK